MVEKYLKKIKPNYYYILAYVLAALAIFLFLTYSQMLSTGKYVIIGGDAWDIYISNIRMLIRTIKSGGNIWYSFATSMGSNTSLTVAFELMSPFNLLFFLFDKADPNIILAVIIICKVGTAGAAFQLFSRKVLGNANISSIVFSVFYAMCAFTVEYCIANFMWLDGIYMLPIVAWATYVAVKKNKFLFLTLSYTYIFIVQFYMGYLLAGFSLLYYILLLCMEKKEERVTKPVLAVAKYTLSAVTAIALSAFLWVPVLTFLVNHTVSDSTQFVNPGVNPLDILNNLFWGEFQDYHTYPYIYCGLPTFLLLPFFFFNRKIELRQKLVYGISLLFFVLGCMVLPIYKLLHGFDAPDMWNFRFSFIVSFLICTIASKQSVFLEEIKKKYLFLYALGLMGLYVLELYLQPGKIGWVAGNSRIGLLINFLAIATWIGLISLLFKAKEKKLAVIVGILLTAIFEVVTNGCVRTFDPVWKQGLTKEDYYYAWEKENERNLAVIEKANASMGEKSFYRLCFFNDAIYNSDAYFGYNGVSDFNSAENENLRDFMSNMGFYTSTRRSSGTGLTLPIEMILSVKDVSRLYIDVAVMGIEPDTKVYENKYYLPLGFMVNDDATYNLEYTTNAFENQNMVLKALSGVDGVYYRIPDENIYQDSQGLVYYEDKAFYYTEDDGYETSFIISGVDDTTFIQIDAADSEDSSSGLTYGVFMNKLSSLDYDLSVPFVAEMLQSDNYHKIVVEASDSFSGRFRTNDMYFYSLSDVKLSEVYSVLSEETLELEEVKNGHILGRINVSGKKTLMFTSIPYTDGWTLTVDGKEQEIEPVLNGTFCGIRLPDAGTHEIEMSYHCPGGLLGGYISLTGVFMLSILIILEGFSLRKKDKKDA